MDWQEFGELGGIDGDDTIFALMDWLREQDSCSSSEIYYIQRGCTAGGLDGCLFRKLLFHFGFRRGLRPGIVRQRAGL